MSDFSNQSDVIDSRDIIARIEELTCELQVVHSELWENSQSVIEEDFDFWLSKTIKDEDHELHDQAVELDSLKSLASECEDYSADWQHGETLVNRDYWIQYTKELIKDCYSDLIDQDTNNTWPYNCVTIDYDKAADELEHDYTTVDYCGQEFLIRSV